MAVQVGQQAPEFTLPSTKNLETLGEAVSLADYKGKWLVLFFYPLDFTGVCMSEIAGFNKFAGEFRKHGAEVLGVSVDSVYSHKAAIKEVGGIDYPLASDIKKETARNYGILMEDNGFALRGTFIIDPEGKIRYELVHEPFIGRAPEEILRVLQALQTGQACPASWKPEK